MTIDDASKVTLSCDHKVVGAVGAAFLSDLRPVLEEPASLDR